MSASDGMGIAVRVVLASGQVIPAQVAVVTQRPRAGTSRRGMVRRYLLVLDMDLLAADERLGLEPISYLLARQQEQPREVVVLSLADHRQARLPALELLLAAGPNITKFPAAPQPGHDIGVAAGHRMNLAVRHLRLIGCRPPARHLAGPGPAAGPGSPAAATPGATADHVPARPRPAASHTRVFAPAVAQSIGEGSRIVRKTTISVNASKIWRSGCAGVLERLPSCGQETGCEGAAAQGAKLPGRGAIKKRRRAS
ncbi:MAG TPA: hypothetical protein VGQ26_18420 [Streptosporangiaceae bacterium]|nr:hypothetical protein [Streptosporangiaceae bacterium]